MFTAARGPEERGAVVRMGETQLPAVSTQALPLSVFVGTITASKLLEELEICRTTTVATWLNEQRLILMKW